MFNKFKRASARISAPLLLVAAASTVGGCANGPLNGFNRDGMRSTAVWRNPDEGRLTDTQYRIVAEHADFCHGEARRQITGAGESAGVMAGIGFVAGGGGVGAGAEASGVGGAGPLGLYGAIANAPGNAGAGVVMNSNARSNFIGTCVKEDIQDGATRTRDPEGMRGVHAAAVPVRTHNRRDRLPAGVVVTGVPPRPSPGREPAPAGN